MSGIKAVFNDEVLMKKNLTIEQNMTVYDVFAEGAITGPTISTINSTAVANASTALVNLQTIQSALEDEDASLDAAITAEASRASTAESTIAAGLATETTRAQAAELANNQRIQTLKGTVSTVTATHAAKLNELGSLHNSDAARLSAVEGHLASRDDAVEEKVNAMIAEHNTDIANLDPRIRAFESMFYIDDSTSTVALKEGYKFKVSELEQVVGTGFVAPTGAQAGDTDGINGNLGDSTMPTDPAAAGTTTDVSSIAMPNL